MKRDYIIFENPNNNSDYICINCKGGNASPVFYLTEVELQEPTEGGSV